MKIFTRRFGELYIEKNFIITFFEGIPGFQNFRKYFILRKDNNKVFCFLHSVENEDLMFILTNPYFFVLDYSFKISNDDCKILGIDKKNIADQLGIFVIAKIDRDKNVYINLKAPICINFNKRVGKQIILYSSDYSHQHKLEPNKINKNSELEKISNNKRFIVPCATSI